MKQGKEASLKFHTGFTITQARGRFLNATDLRNNFYKEDGEDNERERNKSIISPRCPRRPLCKISASILKSVALEDSS